MYVSGISVILYRVAGAVLQREHTGDFFKDVHKVIRTIVPDSAGDLLDTAVCLQKEIFSLVNSQHIQIIGERLPGSIFEDSAKIGCVDIERDGNGA